MSEQDGLQQHVRRRHVVDKRFGVDQYNNTGLVRDGSSDNQPEDAGSHLTNLNCSREN